MAYENLTVAELKELLRERGLPVSGKKADLISRLSEGEDTIDEVPEAVSYTHLTLPTKA